MKYSEIQHTLNKADLKPLPKLNIAILRNIMIESMLPYLRFMAYEMGFEAKIQTGEYDNIVQEAIGANPGLLKAENDIVLVFMKLEGLSWKLARNFASLKVPEIHEEVQRIKALLPGVLDGIHKQTRAMVLWHSFETPLYPGLGVFDSQNQYGQTATIQELNNFLRSMLTRVPNVYFVDLNLCIARLGGQKFYDHRYWHIGRAPYSLDALREIANEDFKFIGSLKGKNKKCLVLDCDNVLWGGVVGEDGLGGIKLGKTYPGSTYYEFQEEIVNLYHRGVLIALCSKNNSEDVWEVFAKHPDMVLKEEFIVASQINWDDKATNLRKIATALNIGLDSLVFVDDNEFEINLVREQLPEVTVMHVPRDRAVEYKEILACFGFFDTLIISEEDRQRGAMYKAEEQRLELKVQAPDLEGYLKSLEMEIEIKFVDALTVPRVVQLTQKTNQFNLTTRRYSEADISQYMQEENTDVLYLRLIDKFGDFGIVGAAILKYSQATCVIDSFLLSCRILGRGVEDVFMRECLKLAKARGYGQAIGEYIPTMKNKQVEGFLEKQGFSPSDHVYDLKQAIQEKGSNFKRVGSLSEVEA